MRFRTILTSGPLAILFSAFLAVAGWSEPAPQPFSRANHPATQSGSVSGRISAVSADPLSVDVQKSQEPVTLRFLIDNNTKIEDVNNIAVHVVVHPAAAY